MALGAKENLRENESLDTQAKAKSQPQDIDKSKLSGQEQNDLQKRLTTIPKIIAERDRHREAAKNQLEKYITVDTEGKTTLTLAESRQYKDELSDLTEKNVGADMMKAFLDKVKDIPRQKEKERAQDIDESKPLDPNHPGLLSLQNEFNAECEKNKHIIGTKQVDGYSAWFSEQRRKEPTIKNLKGIIKDFKGTDSGHAHKDGLAPRHEEYNELTQLFKKHGKKPLDSDYIKKEGLSERKQFRKNAETFENHLNKMKGTGFYSDKMIKESMQEMLMARNPVHQTKILEEAITVARFESQSFTHLDATVTVEGITIRKMSNKGKDKLVAYYKDMALGKREDNVRRWPKFIDDEASLSRELGKIYKDDRDGLKMALKSFEEMEFPDKEKALKDHSIKVKESKDKARLHKELALQGANAKIDEAARKNIISEKTQNRYKEWFAKDENHKNDMTKRPGDIKKLMKNVEDLTSATPKNDVKNLAAYAANRAHFEDHIKELSKTNPNLTATELRKWQDKYDKEGWTGREKIHIDLELTISTEEVKETKKRALEQKIDLKKSTKERLKESPPSEQEAIMTALELEDSAQYAEAMKVLATYAETDPENRRIISMMSLVLAKMKERGKGDKLASSDEKQIDAELDELIANDEEIKQSLEDEQIQTLNIEGAKQSEDKHGGQKDAQIRARAESLAKTHGGGEEEADLTKDFYKNTDEYILNEDKTGEEIVDLDFNKAEFTSSERQSLKRETQQKQTKLHKKEGFSDVTLRKDGKMISSKEAQSHLARDEEKTESKMAEKSQRKAKGALSVHALAFAKRRARQKAEKERHSMLEKQ